MDKPLWCGRPPQTQEIMFETSGWSPAGNTTTTVWRKDLAEYLLIRGGMHEKSPGCINGLHNYLKVQGPQAWAEIAWQETATVVQTKDGVDQLDSHIDCVGFPQWDKGNTVHSRQYGRSGQMSLGVNIMGMDCRMCQRCLKSDSLRWNLPSRGPRVGHLGT